MAASTTTPAGMETIWKIVTPDDLAAWNASGVMTGSDLDEADGVLRSRNGWR